MQVLRFEQSLHDVIGRVVRFNAAAPASTPVEYQLTIETDPGGGMFESTIKYFPEDKRAEVAEISRINAYADQSACIELHADKKFCYCY